MKYLLLELQGRKYRISDIPGTPDISIEIWISKTESNINGIGKLGHWSFIDDESTFSYLCTQILNQREAGTFKSEVKDL